MVKNSGFTFVECVLIIAVMLILGAILIPKLQVVSGARINAAARIIVTDISYAQTLAISTQKKHGIVFRGTPVNTYFIYEQMPANIILNPYKGGSYIIQLNAGDLEGVVIDADYSVEFDPLGAPDAGGAISISSYGSPPSRTIQIEANTGRVMVN